MLAKVGMVPSVPPHPNPLPGGARGLTEYFFDVVISLEAARWALFLCQTNVTIKLQNMTSL